VLFLTLNRNICSWSQQLSENVLNYLAHSEIGIALAQDQGVAQEADKKRHRTVEDKKEEIIFNECEREYHAFFHVRDRTKFRINGSAASPQKYPILPIPPTNYERRTTNHEQFL
jgi:hypothetical protein